MMQLCPRGLKSPGPVSDQHRSAAIRSVLNEEGFKEGNQILNLGLGIISVEISPPGLPSRVGRGREEAPRTR